MTKIARQFNRSAITRYLPFMVELSQSYPTPILVDPAPLSLETFACRFRDAVRGVMEFHQAPEYHEMVSVWFGDYTVAITGNKLIIGAKHEIKRATNKAQSQAIGVLLDAEVGFNSNDLIVSPSDAVLTAIILLLEHNFITHVNLRNVEEETVRSQLLNIRPIEIINEKGLLTLF